jgi:Lamin Tail Domain
MKSPRFYSLIGMVLVLVAILVAPPLVRDAAGQTAYRFDFGAATTESGYVAVSNTTAYPTGTGVRYGWSGFNGTTGLSTRDRATPNDALRRDFVYGTTASTTFRVTGLPSGKYLMKVLCGDASNGNHVITVSVPNAGTLPTMSPRTAQFLQLSATVNTTTRNGTVTLDITFNSSSSNWVVNALTLEAATSDVTPVIESGNVSEWDASVFATDPTQALLNSFSGNGAAGFTATGLTRADYLRLIAGEIDFWKTKQNSSGAIIDPYANSEIQYSTPAFAHAAAVLVAYANRTDLIEPAAKAMDWATDRLHVGAAASGHDDFYPGMLAHGYMLLKPYVAASRAATWASNLVFDPYSVYNYAAGSFNWNVVSSSGEALLQKLGIRTTNLFYVQESWGAQGRHFTSPYGLYMEGPMAYDHFPRIWFEDALAQGYSGPYSTEVGKAMDRAAIASLFMQSPWGEMPAGGRSAHHQWNEAEQCVTYEIYAAKAKAAGNTLMAGAYKRGAHLALSSMFRWVRPSGEMQIVKNWVDPSSRHGYESYSYHSQYNLLPMAMLSMAYEYAAPTEDVTERPAPADTGGFMFQIAGLNKVIANAGGTYIELDTTADHHYDATGLIRVHKKGVPPQLGPSDSLLSAANYNSPDDSSITTGVGVSWQDSTGAWRTLGEMGSTEITSVTVTPVSQSPSRVVFDVTYSGSLPNVTSITEHYVVTPDGVQLTTELSGYSGALRYMWPVLSTDGKTPSTISVNDRTMSVSQDGGTTVQTFTAPGAQSVRVEANAYSNHNGWARLGVAEFPNGGKVTLLISQLPATTGALISEFRLSGPNGALDEFVEIYNNTDAALDLTGWTLVAGSTPTVVATIPSGKSIPARGHLLLTNSGYNLDGAATGDMTYATDLSETTGIGLRNASGALVDSVGFTSNALVEGTGLTATGTTQQYSFVRRYDFDTFLPVDTNNNLNDFELVSTTENSPTGARLGSPGPENLASPIENNTLVPAALLDTAAVVNAEPNRGRNATAIANFPAGTLTLRRRVTNNTGAAITVLRLRVVILPAGATRSFAGAARTAFAGDEPGEGVNIHIVSTAGETAVPTSGGPVNTAGTTIDSPLSPLSSGGYNTSVVVALPGGSLANGASIPVSIKLAGVVGGQYKAILSTESK